MSNPYHETFLNIHTIGKQCAIYEDITFPSTQFLKKNGKGAHIFMEGDHRQFLSVFEE